MGHFEVKSVVPAPRTAVFSYLCDPAKLAETLSQHIDVEDHNQGRTLESNNEFRFTMTRFGLSQPVRFLVTEYDPGQEYRLRLTEGLFEKWLHTEKFADHGDDATLVTVIVDYIVPLGLMGHLFDDLLLRRDLKQLIEARLQKAVQHFQDAL